VSTRILTPAWTVDGWSGNYIDDDGVRWFVDQETGWFDGVDSRTFDSDRVNAGGSYSSPSLDAVRVITLAGDAKAPTPEAAERARNQINAVGRRGHLHQLVVEEPVTDKTAMVKRAGGKATPYSPHCFYFQLVLVAPDPLKYAADSRTASTRLAQDAPGGVQWNGPAGSTGVQWNGPAGSTGLVYQTGAGENGVMQLVNDGTADTPVQFTVAGPVTNPIIVRTETGETIAWNGTVPTGSVLQIDTGTGAVLLNNGNQRPLLTAADFFTVPAGSSINVAFQAPAPSPTAQLTAVWSDAWY
jgi:hypothetical protein